MKKTVSKWLFLFGVLTVTSLVIIWLSYLNINTRVVYAKNGSVTLSSNDVKDGFVLLDGQLRVSDGLYTPENADSAEWYFSNDLRTDTNVDNHTLSFSIKVTDGSDLCFLALQPSNLRIWINDMELPAEQLKSGHIYNFSEFASTGNQNYRILLQVGAGSSKRDHYHGFILGTQEQLINVFMAWVSSGMIAVGVCMFMLIQSLALYIQKRSERYLLILVLIVLQSGLRGIEIAMYPLLSIFWPGMALSEFAQILFRLPLPLNLLLLANIFPKEIGRKVWTVGLLISGFGIVCSISKLMGIHSVAIYSNNVEQAMLLVETLCILRSFMRDRYGSHVLLVGAFAYITGRVFASLISFGIVPIGIVDTYYYPWQYANLIYLISYVVAIDGIFARKFSEADLLYANLQRVNADLENIVAERTAKLKETNHKLAESNETLLQFQQAKQVFLGNVVHNLRTPLFTLGVAVEMLQEDSADHPQFASRLKKIIDKIDFIQRMINELFFVVRIDDGRVFFDMKQQDLCPLLTQISLEYQQKAEHKERIGQPDIPESPVQVIFDGLFLRQAIENIVDNAIRYSPDGVPIQLSVILSADKVLIEITNFGDVIAAEDMPHIFERYYKGKESKPDQTGLGLAIAQEIVQKHGGVISVISNPEGTCFTIALPLA